MDDPPEETTKMRKIELQSPEDMRYLIHRVGDAAREKVALHIPPTDPVRARVEELVLEYVESAFALATSSIDVNGLPALNVHEYTNPIEEFEPYDRVLHDRVTGLNAGIEKRTLQLAGMRRERGREVAEGIGREVEEEGRREERLVKGWERKMGDAGVGEGGGVGGKGVVRGEEVEAARKRAEVGLEALKGRLPEVSGRLGEAGRAASFVLERV